MWHIKIKNDSNQENLNFEVDSHERRFKENLENMKHLLDPRTIYKYLRNEFSLSQLQSLIC